MSFFRRTYKGTQRRRIRIAGRRLRHFVKSGNKAYGRATIAKAFGGTIR